MIRISVDKTGATLIKVTHILSDTGEKMLEIPDEFFSMTDLWEDGEVFLDFKNPAVELLNEV